MCEFEKKLTLCTCYTDKDPYYFQIRRKLEKYLKTSITSENNAFYWTLADYLGHQEKFLIGMTSIPGNVIGTSLTNDFVISQLNNRNCFDFDYTPKEGENLMISEQSDRLDREYLSFIFRDGKWKIGSYNSFIEKTEVKNFGNVHLE